VESTETVILTLGPGTGYSVGTPTSATGSIADNDALTSEERRVGKEWGAEQGQDPIVFTVTRDTNLVTQITVGHAWSGTATRGTDYVATISAGGTLNGNNQTQLTIGTNVGRVTSTQTPVDDSTIESTETAILTLASGTGYTLRAPTSATGSIADNDAL